MSGDHGEHGHPGGEQQREARQAASDERRKQPAGLVFDDPLDRPTADDTDTGWGDLPSGGSGGRDLEWYLSQKPPHHGG